MQINGINSFNNIANAQKTTIKESLSPKNADSFSSVTSGQSMNLTQQQVKELLNAKADVDVKKAESLWKFPLNDSRNKFIQAQDNSLYIQVKDGLAKADGYTGKEAWRADIKLPLLTFPVQEGKDGSILVVDQESNLHSIDPKTGKDNWKNKLGGKFEKPYLVDDDGSILAFNMKDDKLHLSRLGMDGKELSTTELGYPDDSRPDMRGPLFEGNDTDGNITIHVPLREKSKNSMFDKTSTKVFVIAKDGKIKSETDCVKDAFAFPGDSKRFYMEDREGLTAVDKNTGEVLWKKARQFTGSTSRYGGSYGDLRYDFGTGENYKNIRLVDSSDDRLILEGYIEESQPTSRTDREFVAVNPDDPGKILWKTKTDTSTIYDPLYCSKDLIVHVKKRSNCSLEAIDPATGKTKWMRAFKDKEVGTHRVGRPHLYKEVDIEDPDRYQVRIGKDGTLYIRTYKKIFGVDPETGMIKHLINGPNEFINFELSDDNKTVHVMNGKTGDIENYVFEKGDSGISRAAQKIMHNPDSSEPDPKIEIKEKTVNIGGVTLQRNK